MILPISVLDLAACYLGRVKNVRGVSAMSYVVLVRLFGGFWNLELFELLIWPFLSLWMLFETLYAVYDFEFLFISIASLQTSKPRLVLVRNIYIYI